MQKKNNPFEMAEQAGTGGEVECILEFDVVQIHLRLSKRMKTHQSEGVKFLYGTLVESVAKLEQNSSGTGAILFHCMGKCQLRRSVRGFILGHAFSYHCSPSLTSNRGESPNMG